jgi:hypothetical protein
VKSRVETQNILSLEISRNSLQISALSSPEPWCFEAAAQWREAQAGVSEALLPAALQGWKDGLTPHGLGLKPLQIYIGSRGCGRRGRCMGLVGTKKQRREERRVKDLALPLFAAHHVIGSAKALI